MFSLWKSPAAGKALAQVAAKNVRCELSAVACACACGRRSCPAVPEGARQEECQQDTQKCAQEGANQRLTGVPSRASVVIPAPRLRTAWAGRMFGWRFGIVVSESSV